MLVSLQTIIGMAEKGNYCIPAFNVYNTETVMGVISAAEEAHAPVIVQVYPRLIHEEVGFYICPAAVAAARATVEDNGALKAAFAVMSVVFVMIVIFVFLRVKKQYFAGRKKQGYVTSA